MDLTAKAFERALWALQSDEERAKIAKHRRNRDAGVIGVRMKAIFDTAATYTDMPLDEVERLLESPYYDARMGAVSILDFKARRKRTTQDERRELYELYLRRHDRIDDWDLVDRAAPRVLGWYLLDKPREALFTLARSGVVWERRSAITAAFWFVRQGDVDDALALAAILLDDEDELVHKSVGTALREVGAVDRDRLVSFLREHGGAVPRLTLRTAVAKLPSELRTELMGR